MSAKPSSEFVPAGVILLLDEFGYHGSTHSKAKMQSLWIASSGTSTPITACFFRVTQVRTDMHNLILPNQIAKAAPTRERPGDVAVS